MTSAAIAIEGISAAKRTGEARRRGPGHYFARGLVYFAQAPSGGPVKIGWAWEPERRVRDLSPKCGMGLIVAATVPGGIGLEHEYHERFAGNLALGIPRAACPTEWFDPTTELANEVNRLGGSIVGPFVMFTPSPKLHRPALDALRAIVLERRLSWNDIGRELGVSSTSVGQWLRGHGGPNAESRRRMEAWSGGRLRFDGWGPLAHRRASRARRPFPLDLAS